MTTRRAPFFQREGERGGEDWYALARDAATGRLFVQHDWSHRRGAAFAGGRHEIELEAFLAQDGPAQDALRGRTDALMTEIEAIEAR